VNLLIGEVAGSEGSVWCNSQALWTVGFLAFTISSALITHNIQMARHSLGSQFSSATAASYARLNLTYARPRLPPDLRSFTMWTESILP